MQTADHGGAHILTLPSKRGERTVAIHSGSWAMVTLTLRHHAGQSLSELLRLLLDAWRAVRSTRAVRDIFRRRVTASARGIEVTWSEHNGWHPHIHLMLRTQAWTSEELETLEREWLRAVPGQPGVAVAWSRTPASYLAKLSAEVAGIAKEAAGGHYNAWQLARAALARPELVLKWKEYQRAMKGRRILELDERAKALAALAPEPPKWSEKTECPMYAEEYRALASLETRDPDVLWLALEAVASATDPPYQLRVYLDDALQGSFGARAA